MRYPSFLKPREYVWAHELVHATAAHVMGWEPLAVTASAVSGACWFEQHPLRIIRAAPHIALSKRNLDNDEDFKEFLDAYPDGECRHPLAGALEDEVYFIALWRAVKRHWRSKVLIDPMSCQYVKDAARILGEMYAVLGAPCGQSEPPF